MRPVEHLVGGTLRTGVMLAAVVAGVGGIDYLSQHRADPASYGTFVESPAAMRSISGVLHGALSLGSEWLIAVGILLLIATPIVRVALLVFVFAIERDALYVALSALVLTVLLVSLV